MMADVAFADRAEDRVGDGVRENVGVRVAVKAVRMRNLHAAENERAAFRETMDVVADAGEGHAGEEEERESGMGMKMRMRMKRMRMSPTTPSARRGCRSTR